MDFIYFLVAWGVIGILIGVFALRMTHRISHMEE
jgi:hypothetical protein